MVIEAERRANHRRNYINSFLGHIRHSRTKVTIDVVYEVPSKALFITRVVSLIIQKV